MRAFVAVDTTPEIKSAIQGLVLELKRKKGNVRWVGAGGMHLTLIFLGDIDEARLPEMGNALKEVAAGHPGFRLSFEGTGTFPEDRTPRVLWAGVRNQPELLSLQKDMSRALEPLGYSPEEREFHPHLTLGRVKSSAGIGETAEELAKHRESAWGEMEVRKITFFESLLKPDGVEYRVVMEFDLP